MPDEAPTPDPTSAKAEATFFRPDDEVHIHHGNLPHWRQDSVSYFITTRLADSMPVEKLREWQRKRDHWLAVHGLQRSSDLHELSEAEQHEFHATYTQNWHEHLDAGFGECHFRRTDVRSILIRRLCAEPSLDAWVIMPNHLHALIAPQTTRLSDLMQSWKGGSSFEINRLLRRTGPLWQKETYDHIVRSEQQWRHYRRYIAGNPIKAKLRPGEYAIGVGREVFDSAEAFKKWLRL